MNKGSFEKCRLSSDSLEKIKDALSLKKFNFNPAWLPIGGKSWYAETLSDTQQSEKSAESDYQSTGAPNEEFQDSQFFYTQAPIAIFKEPQTGSILPLKDLIQNSIESLEHSNETLDFSNFKNLSDQELTKVCNSLKERLSETGISNFCYSISKMDTEQSVKFLPTLCSKFLIPMIIESEKGSGLIKKGICECATKFPEEIIKLVLTEIFSKDLQNTSTLIEIIKTFGKHKYCFLLSEFVNHTRELKQWHFPILQMFFSVKHDNNTRIKLFILFSKSAMTFSKDKGYANMIHTFAKENNPLSEEEKLILRYIAALNKTLLKKLIEKCCKE